MEPSTTSGRKGSLANPEVREDIPGHVIPILEREFDDFDNEAEKFLDGQTEEVDFIGFRLKQGVYGQRQADVQMIRVKLPMGGITPDQMDASFAKTFATKSGMIDGVREYREEGSSSDVYYVDWTEDIQVVAPQCARRITLS